MEDKKRITNYSSYKQYLDDVKSTGINPKSNQYYVLGLNVVKQALSAKQPSGSEAK